MPPGKHAVSPDLDPGGRSDELCTFGETFPCAIALWSRDRSRCSLNTFVKRLINYSETDFLQRPALWTDSIHPDDQRRFFQSQERLAASQSPVQCDYRFFPRNSDRP